MKDDYFCPMPTRWNEIYTALLQVWEQQGKRPEDKPPVPLILAAWHETPGLMKLLRWKGTIQWAQAHERAHLIQELSEDEKFRG